MTSPRTRLAMAIVGVTLIAPGCSDNDKSYDISPVFPLSQDKCQKYNGVQSGTFPNATCMVSKGDCERAASDWNAVMSTRGIRDAVRFTCRS